MFSKQRPARAPRFHVPNKEQAVIILGAEKITGILVVLSRTGGTIRLQRQIPSGTLADIAIRTTSGTFSAAIELLRVRSGKDQPFKFLAMSPTARGRLNEGLTKMRMQGLAIQKTPMDHFRALAQRVFPRGSVK